MNFSSKWMLEEEKRKGRERGAAKQSKASKPTKVDVLVCGQIDCDDGCLVGSTIKEEAKSWSSEKQGDKLRKVQGEGRQGLPPKT